MKKNYLAASLALSSVVTANAASIGVNFSENDGNQPWLNATSLIGPTNIQAGFFNTTNSPTGVAGLPLRTGSLAAGSIANLADSTGSATSAAVTWSSSNVWWNSDGTGSDQQNLAVGYLDDGGSGISITVTGVPYSQYKVYGLLTSDQGNTYVTQDFNVNGSGVLGGSATAYGTIAQSTTSTGSAWSPLTLSQAGNYWVSGTQTNSTLTITAPTRSGNDRASITGFIIEQVPVPEPSALLLGLGAVSGLALRRRRQN